MSMPSDFCCSSSSSSYSAISPFSSSCSRSSVSPVSAPYKECAKETETAASLSRAEIQKRKIEGFSTKPLVDKLNLFKSKINEWAEKEKFKMDEEVNNYND